MDDLITEFLTETNESLGALDLDLVNLEQNPNDKELLSNIFRLMHTIKGTCGFLGLSRLEKVAHHAENVLGRFRDGDLEVTPEYVTLIFESLDRIKDIISNIEGTGNEGEGDDSPLIEQLDIVYEGKSENASSAPGEQDSKTEETLAPDQAAAKEEEEEEAPAPAEDSKPAQKQATEKTPPKDAPQETPPVKDKPAAAQSLRVNVEVIENLMTMVSELVLTRNQLLQILRIQKESEFSAPLQRLNHVVSELQDGVMKTRMQPIGNAWAKLPRIIRDLSIELGKKIELEMRGQDTELDRQVLDMIKDPLTHMVRNSADHGIEMPEERSAAGKPETGHILLNAYHEGGHIIIEIKDDGKGLSTDKIKDKIVKNGLATEDELDSMSSQQIHQFIFKAGFSTAEQVTAVSGRGVGMDVVRTNIEKIGGSIELKSKEGKGSTFMIKIPLTLAIVSALIVESGGERFAIPQLAVKELVMASQTGENRIEMIKGTPIFRLRDQLLPLVTLEKLLHLEKENKIEDVISEAAHQVETIEDTKEEDASTTETSAAQVVETPQTEAIQADENPVHIDHKKYIVVTQIGAYMFGIIVDKVFDTEEIVVKPVANIIKNIEMFSGNTILGDGSVIMILDPSGIAKASGEIETPETTDHREAEVHSDHHDVVSLLLFKAGNGTPKAVALSLVSRLEEIKLTDIEHSDGVDMIQYRGQLMPVMPFDPELSLADEGQKPMLVFADDNLTIGLIVDEIVDIAEEEINIQLAGSKPGIIGSAIIQSKASDVVDVGHYLREANKNWFNKQKDEPYSGNKSQECRVLLVDDSPFFRNMLTPVLTVAGYHVTTLESPLAALEMCDSGVDFDVIVSDIEMPEMDGFEFAAKLRSDTRWKDTPIVALSSHTTEYDKDRGRSVGFSNYIAKFDREALLKTLTQTLHQLGDAA